MNFELSTYTDMKLPKVISNTLRLTIGTALLASCGLVDIDLDEIADVAGQMDLGRDTVYVMAGDRYVIRPTFTPDTIANKQVFYVSSADTVAKMVGDTVVALSEGWTTVTGISVSSRLPDSCQVCVMPLWVAPTPYAYPYETIVYADVTIHDAVPTKDMVVGAFVGDELRAIGQPLTVDKYKVMFFRVLSDADPDYEGQMQPIKFRYYDHSTCDYELFPLKENIVFDGETYGTLAKPVILKL